MKTLIALFLSILLVAAPIASLVALIVALITVNLKLAGIAALVLVCYAFMIYALSGFLDRCRKEIERPSNVTSISKRKGET
jgi:membrane protein implicated in regulation of membrane protease activity